MRPPYQCYLRAISDGDSSLRYKTRTVRIAPSNKKPAPTHRHIRAAPISLPFIFQPELLTVPHLAALLNGSLTFLYDFYYCRCRIVPAWWGRWFMEERDERKTRTDQLFNNKRWSTQVGSAPVWTYLDLVVIEKANLQITFMMISFSCDTSEKL